MIQVRLSKEYDVPVIAEFQIRMAYETEGIHLDKDTVNKGVNAVFKDERKGQYYVAIENNTIVGSMLITYEWSDWRNNCVYWLQSVYIIPEKRRKGIFNMMYNLILQKVNDNKDVAGLRLYVDKGNIGARNVYKKIGMNGDHYQVFELMK